MMERCNNINHKDYKYYGARGISVCDEWHNIQNFIKDMYPYFEDGLTLDRIDNDKDYSKDNCRWTNKKIQSRNTRKIRSNNTSGYRGIVFDKKRNKFRAKISVDNKSIHLGRFITALEAARAYDNYIITNNLEHTRNFN